MSRNPFAEVTTVSTPAALRIKVVAIEGDTVTLAQEFTYDLGHSVTSNHVARFESANPTLTSER